MKNAPKGLFYTTVNSQLPLVQNNLFGKVTKFEKTNILQSPSLLIFSTIFVRQFNSLGFHFCTSAAKELEKIYNLFHSLIFYGFILYTQSASICKGCFLK